MGAARLSVQFAGPLVTIQDGGRVGNLRYGVTASGPMDRTSFAAANAALGNPTDQTCIEISLGGLVVECKEGAVSLAIAGGDFIIDHGGAKTSGWTVLTLQPGEKLAIRGGASGSWAYLALAGGLVATEWLGHTATLSTSGFGGGALQAGQELVVENAEQRLEREGAIALPQFDDDRSTFRVVMGPQDGWFPSAAITAFLEETFQVTDSYDRMGMRLAGPVLSPDGALSIPSEPIIRGSVQVSGEGVATVLLADHQTTGGYPKIATVISADLDRLTQRRSREDIRFEAITPSEAVTLVRARHTALRDYLSTIAEPRGSLAQRLMSQNLITVAAEEN
ncbi:biotin-dependent carboxyltransferase family protein [Pseudahrensia aquimaris]|uniref:Biotin-dependent carboxyltransferase family protein n=1 Tax=Pseudahrensia aquimaris TaxID=744461 RepID=A0ABW3FDS7_9HYPH